MAERRQLDLPTEDDMCITEAEAEPVLGPKGAEASGPFMRHRLRDCARFWQQLGASPMVMDWVCHGFKAWFSTTPPNIRLENQPSCYEPERHFNFITDSVAALRARGVLGIWDPQWGPPRVVSPLKIVPKKGGKLRLILDLSRLNKFIVFPRFRYDSINQVRDLLSPGDYMFAWDLKDGYWHTDLHEDMWAYMCFKWQGVTYF